MLATTHRITFFDCMDYLEKFPLPTAFIPPKLGALLRAAPVDDPHLNVEVAANYENDLYGDGRESVQLQMIAVPRGKIRFIGNLNNSAAAAVESPIRITDKRGDLRKYSPDAWGFDPIVMSWGTGLFFAYNLSEKVWTSLGLSPRCFGNANQKIVYDDLSAPEFGVAGGEISSSYYFTASRNVSWTIRNDYLRRYLWMRGAVGMRVFFYETLLDDCLELRAIMNGNKHYVDKQEGSWYLLDIREHKDRLLLQVWATVTAVSCKLCPQANIHQLIWPGDTEPMTTDRLGEADARLQSIYLQDTVLERYEQNAAYTTVPYQIDGMWACGPSYHGQWSFGNWRRVNRNLIRVSAYDIYHGVPDREILHAHSHAIALDRFPENEQEHIVAKVQRFLDQMLDLSQYISHLSVALGVDSKPPEDIVGFSRDEIKANGWYSYPILCKLGQVAPLDMTEQAFLSRCKTLNEAMQRIPNAYLKSLLRCAGCANAQINQLGSIKLLEALTNIVGELNRNQDDTAAFPGTALRIEWSERNPVMAPLFVNNDLRIANAHEANKDWLLALERLGFDIAQINDGYGHALDFVIDAVIDSLGSINNRLAALLRR